MIYQEELSNIHIFLEQKGKEAEKGKKKKKTGKEEPD